MQISLTGHNHFCISPVPENISFLWKPLTLELKPKKFLPIIKMTTLKDFEAYLVTLKLDDSRCRIHSISDDDGNGTPGRPGPLWGLMKKKLPTKGMWLCPGKWLPDMAKT